MCDPVTALIAGGSMLVGSSMAKARGASAPTTDPEAERLKAEADAATSANRKLAADKLRRREQQSLLARGGSQPTLGDDMSAPPGGLFSAISYPVRRSTSLLSRGASSTSAGGGGLVSSGGGGSGRTRVAQL